MPSLDNVKGGEVASTTRSQSKLNLVHMTYLPLRCHCVDFILNPVKLLSLDFHLKELSVRLLLDLSQQQAVYDQGLDIHNRGWLLGQVDDLKDLMG
jgi:hypothetical protein